MTSELLTWAISELRRPKPRKSPSPPRFARTYPAKPRVKPLPDRYAASDGYFLEDVPRCGCIWPTHMAEGRYRFCGDAARIEPGKSRYCAAHIALSVEPPKRRVFYAEAAE